MRCGKLHGGDTPMVNRKTNDVPIIPGAGGPGTAPSLSALYLQAHLGLQTVCVPYLGDA